MNHTPVQLFNHGVTDDEWKEHIHRLSKINKKRYGCIYLGIATPIIALFCPCYMISCYAYDGKILNECDSDLKQWQNDFNKECLEPNGIYCKTQSHKALDTNMVFLYHHYHHHYYYY